MSLYSLVDGDVQKYFLENRASDSCWFFVHIPKTAGSSFRREITEIRRPNQNVEIARDQRQIPYHQKVADATREFSARLKQQPCSFASGHVPVTVLMQHVEDWQQLRLMTMLREPATRMISDYRYQTTSAHPSHREFIERFPAFESYLEAEWTRNRIFKFLRPSRNSSLEECIEFVVRRFTFVGIVEMYPFSVRLATRLLGSECGPSRRLRKTVETEHNRFEVTSELLNRVRELNSQDAEIYTYFRDRLRTARDAAGLIPTQ